MKIGENELFSAERLYENTPYKWLFEEHKERYHFVKDNVSLANKKILDIACGSGYGSFILSMGGGCCWCRHFKRSHLLCKK